MFKLLSNVKKGDGKKCLALGLGVGALGTSAATLAGAVCPLCIVITPALMGSDISASLTMRIAAA